MGNYDYANESLRDTLRNNKSTAIGIGILLTALILIFGYILPKAYAPITNEITNVNQVVKDNDIKRGKMDSNVTVILYEDPQCPGCQALAKTESKKLEAFRDRVKFVYKYVKAVPGHTFAKEANSYIYAAEAISGKGYELVEKSYNDTANPQALTKNEFFGYAKELGLDQTALTEKANSKEIINQVGQQTTDFAYKIPTIEGFTNREVAVSGTPGGIIIIDGKVVRITIDKRNNEAAMVDKTKDFYATMISDYLEKYFNSSSISTPEVTPTKEQ
jgi:hypothetical protein